MMTTPQILLTETLHTAQLTQYRLQQCMNEASCHAMKSVILAQLEEYDRIETELLNLSACRGWELPEPELSGKYLYRFRMTHRLHKSDSDLSARMIFDFTKDLLRIRKLFNHFQTEDPMLRGLTQKLLDCKTIGIQQMQPFL